MKQGRLFLLYAFVLRNGFHSNFYSLFCVVLFLAPLRKPTIHQLVIKQIAIQVLTAIALRSDTDSDNVIEGAEIDTLILRLSSVNGITLNEEKFKERVIAKGGDIRAVQRLVNHLQHEDENVCAGKRIGC